MELIYLQPKSNRFTLPQQGMHIHPKLTPLPRLLLATLPDEAMQRCVAAYECM